MTAKKPDSWLYDCIYLTAFPIGHTSAVQTPGFPRPAPAKKTPVPGKETTAPSFSLILIHS